MTKKTWSSGDQVDASDLNAGLDWQLIASATSLSGAHDFTDLGSWGEILVVFDGVSRGDSTNFQVWVSSDNGSTVYNSASSYVVGTTSESALNFGGVGSVTGYVHLFLFNKAVKSPAVIQAGGNGNTAAIVNHAVALDAVRCGNNFNGSGTIYIYGR